ncbi:hypothetical protein C499_11933 [Halogeometricum borinquense DSM 11551]|uniref:Uncharacterized protein n=1 Tax=Halogeometricum borinquense (strain ATCC 700274 / DSM 11551 / JCM 10706 / KCTC 4070 / PR3) TaxID=469382 RepID=E4NTG6_HALBP|nr:hypothetical protein Hbor_03010 [Halogeometricum borinquense DSM 11551]ELY26269.1 hypothetical protein C499_11933 [Halogeometricum borinquense DSM 11551]
MNWKHRRDRTKAESKKEETKTGTKWSFIAAAVGAA